MCFYPTTEKIYIIGKKGIGTRVPLHRKGILFYRRDTRGSFSTYLFLLPRQRQGDRVPYYPGEGVFKESLREGIEMLLPFLIRHRKISNVYTYIIDSIETTLPPYSLYKAGKSPPYSIIYMSCFRAGRSILLPLPTQHLFHLPTMNQSIDSSKTNRLPIII